MLSSRSLFANLGSKAGKKVEDDDDIKKAPDKQDDQDEAEKLRKAKKKSKNKKEDEDDDCDDEDETETAKAARARERGRVRAIFLSAPGMANPMAAAHLALDTSMSRDKAISTLGHLNEAMAAGAAERADAEHQARPDVSMAAAIIAAGAKARGEDPTPIPPGRRQRMGLLPGQEQPPPRRDMAAAIIAAGRKARGEA